MPRVSGYLSVRRVGFLLGGVTLTLLVVLVIAIYVRHIGSTNRKWIALSVDFVEQANTLGAKLPPAGVGAIRLPQCEADELILLDAYCPRQVLDERLPELSASSRYYLHSIAQDDGFAPVLVWLRCGHVLAINPARFLVGVNFSLNVWQLSGPREIKVIKEKNSSNGFLSIYFVDD
jgi:hypothetical protein